MIRNSVPVVINEEKFEIAVNVGSMIAVEKMSGQGFMKVLGGMENGELVPLSILLSACLKRDGKPVGLEFVENLTFNEMESLLNPLIEAIGKAFPTDNGKEKNVKTAQKTMK